jgi:hypothetical protein
MGLNVYLPKRQGSTRWKDLAWGSFWAAWWVTFTVLIFTGTDWGLIAYASVIFASGRWTWAIHKEEAHDGGEV